MALETPRLNLPYIAAAQAQKHVTHNEALRTLDVLCQISVSDVVTSFPASPIEGACYLVGAGGQGDLANKEHYLLAFTDGAWMDYAPQVGWVGWLASEDKLIVYDGQIWSDVNGEESTDLSFLKLGINATPDDTNRLSIKSDEVLHSHDDITPGNGSVRHKLNKAATSDNASFLFQTNFSGRAEIGLAGDDDFHFKVSPDGTNFTNSLSIDKVSGLLNIAQGLNFGQETLNIYDVGTFTPFFTESSPTATITHSVQQGNYVRIGDVVFLWLTLQTSSVLANGSNQKLRIGGLPFASKNNSGNHYGGLIFFSKGFSQTSNPKTILYLEGTSSIELETAATSDSRSEFDTTIRIPHMATGLNRINAFIPFIAA